MNRYPRLRLQNAKGLAFLIGLSAFSLLISACLPLESVLDRSPISAFLSPPTAPIAYTGADGNIYTINLDGDNLHAVTNDAHLVQDSKAQERFYQFPTWSPDRRRLAFIGTARSGSSASTVSLYTANPDGGNPLEVYSSKERAPFYLYWSPDSQHLTFLTSGEGDILFLHLVTAQGGDAQILARGQPFYWVWSPDSQRIFIHTGGAASLNPDARLSFLKLNDGIIEQKLDFRPAAFQAPAWSPEGTELLLVAEAEGEQNALLLTDDQGMEEKILLKTQGAIAFAWSPDGARLAYIADADPRAQILSSPLKIIEPDLPEEAITTLDEHVIAFFWSPDSHKIAYYVPVLGSPGDELVQFGQTEPNFGLSLRVLDIATGAAKELALFVPTSQFLNILPFFDQYHRSVTIWSPDSQHLVYSALEAHIGSGIFTVSVSGDQPPTRIAVGDLAFWAWK
jgi:TolB protein